MENNTHTFDPYGLVRLPIEMWPVDKVRPYPKNNKIHGRADIDKMKASIRQFGIMDPLIVDGAGVLIAGHKRFASLCELNHVEVPVRVARDLTPNQVDAARIAHNKTTTTEYDSGFLAEELARLADADDVDLNSLGFDARELEFLTQELGDMNIDGLAVDLDAEIDAQDQASRDKVAEVDAGETPIAKVLGFKALPTRAAPAIRRFISEIEASTGKAGAEAFVEWINARAA